MRNLLVILLAVALVGCSDRPDETPAEWGKPLFAKVQTLPMPGDGLSLVTLDDGTRCVVYSGLNGRSGLSCDWAPRRVE